MGKRNHSYRKVKALFENYYRYLFTGPRRCGKTTRIVEEAIKNLLAGYDVDVYAPQNTTCDILRREIYRDLSAAELSHLTNKVRVRRANQLTAHSYRGRTAINVRILIDELSQVIAYSDMELEDWYRLLCSNQFAAGAYTPEDSRGAVRDLLERVERDHPYMRVTPLAPRQQRESSRIRGYSHDALIIDEMAHSPAWVTTTHTGGTITAELLTSAYEAARDSFATTTTELRVDPAMWRAIAGGMDNISVGYNVVDTN